MLASDEKVITNLSKASGVNYSDEQLKILNHKGGMCILACAGSGKTTVLSHLLAKRILTGEISNTNKLLCTTYSKPGATEMDERLTKLFKKVGIKSEVTVKTLHAFYLMVLKHFNFSTSVIDNKLRLKFITESCRDAKIQLGDEDLQLIDSLLSYQINNLMSDEALVKSYVYTLDNVSQQQYTEIRVGYNNRKQQNNLIDFDDMQLYMYMLLYKQGREDILQYCRSRWEYFYIDEAQDVSKIQFAILRKLMTDPNKIVFIGDDDQCIYQWRGADPSIILNICGYYDIEKFLLSTNYRCRGNIVRPAAVGITNNVRRAEKTMTPFQEGGQIRVCDTLGGNLYTQSKYAYKHIKNLIVNENVSPDNIAVLSRNNQHLAILNSMLFKDGIYCNTTSDMKLTNSSMYKDVKNLVEMSLDGYNHNITASTLWRVCLYMGVKGAKAIADFQNAAGIKLSDALGYILNNHTRNNVDWKGSFKVPPAVGARIEAMCQHFKEDTIQYMVYTYKILKETKELEKIAGLMAMYIKSTEFMYKSQDRIRSINGVMAYILDLTEAMGVEKLKSFFRASEQFDSGKMAVPGSKVRMSTMHGAKGLEWEHVVLFADDNVTFPSFDGIVSMIKKGVSMEDISDSIDENRRLHYVAVTRAKSDLTIFTDSKNVSVYTLEALGIFKPESGSSNTHIINMAKCGEVYTELIEKAQKEIFNENSEYYYKLDISDVGSTDEFEYFGGNENKNSISLDSIQTY